VKLLPSYQLTTKWVYSVHTASIKLGVKDGNFLLIFICFASYMNQLLNLTVWFICIRALSLLDFKPEQVAEQMTLLDAELFLTIEASLISWVVPLLKHLFFP
jgi:hypothetical protein